jgi:alanyl-tRNA synthetase
MNDIPPYWNDPNRSEFDVSIERIEQVGKFYHIQIKEDVIRPSGGGQAGERGHLTIEDSLIPIIDTISESDGIVLVSSEKPFPGHRGKIEIDMEWRQSMMKNHTAEHLLASVIKRQKKDTTIGQLWIDGNHGSVELLGEDIELDTIFEAETEVLDMIERNVQVESIFVDSSQVDPTIRTREGLTEKHERLRIVTIGEIDSCACSGIHVLHTRDIGFFKVLDVKKNERSTHIEFVTGIKAGHYVSKTYNIALQPKYSYPFEMEQLGAVLDKAKQAIDIKQKLIEKIIELLTESPSVEELQGVIFRHEYLPGFDSNTLNVLANRMSSATPSVLLLFAPGTKSHVILQAHNMPQEASYYISDAVNQIGGRGGGKADLFSGGFTEIGDPVQVYESLIHSIQKLIRQ